MMEEALQEFFNELVSRLMEVWGQTADCRWAIDAVICRIREFEAEFLDPFGDGA